jgi:hypothetical protein
MIHAEFAVAAAALVVTVAVASAQAQTQTASAGPSIWDHNGSVVYLVANGQSREFHYQKPRAGMLEVGARPGSLLFRGEIDNGLLENLRVFKDCVSVLVACLFSSGGGGVIVAGL